MSAVTPEYRKAVTELAEKNENRRFLNDSRDHAKLLIDLMVGRSQENDEVLIYSGELKTECFGDSFQNAKGKIRVVLDSAKGLEVIAALPPALRNRIEPRILKEPDGNHFLVAGRAMRFELSHDDATAVANFNEPESELQKLRDRFSRLWDLAESPA
jgi:hypothetical protein